MNPQMFLGNFGYIANAPDGVGRVRNVVLSLAFQGKLAKHSDAHVDDLLTSIDELASHSKRRRRNLTDAVTGNHLIPSHWRWVTMERIGHDWGQIKPISDFTYIDVSSIDNKRGVISESPKLITAAAAPSRARKIVKKGTVIYSTVRPYLRNIVVVDQDFEPKPIASTAFAILHPFEGVEAKYIYYYLRSPAFVAYVESVQSGIAYPAISDQKFFTSALPLAPTDEQKRIVAKVDELMALCDKLEAQQQERERLFPVLSRACHARFVGSPTLVNLKAIFDEVGSVSPEELRKTILTLAVQGKLVPQDPKDKPAEQWLLHCQKRNKNRYAFNRTASDNEIIGINPLPDGWIATQLDQIFMVSGGIQKTPQRTPRDNAFPYLGVANVYRNRLDLTNIKKFELKHSELERYKLEAGDLLIIEGNGSIDQVGRCAQWNGEIENCVHQNHIIRCRPADPEIGSFILLFLNSPAGMDIMKELAITSSGLYTLSVGKIKKIKLNLPPIAEQYRIVAKVDQLMALIDKLEKQQAKKSELAQAFAQAAVAAITGTEIKEPEKMKAPKTELVSRLQAKNTPNATDPAPLTKLLTKNNGELPTKTLWQQSGLNIDAFYQQLRTEMAEGWIVEPEKAVMKEIEVD